MKKNLFLLAAAGIALASCSSEDYVGDSTPVTPASVEKAIGFGAGNSAITRAGNLTGETAANKLNKQFVVYGVKTSGTESVVFPQYGVEYVGSTSSASNTNGWEYVGLTGFSSQTIKYWDYTATNYTFQAWSKTTGNASVSNVTSTGFKVSGTADDLAKFYIADKVSIDKSTSTSGTNTYGGVVAFTFRNGAAKVRFGMYESIVGYTVSAVTFRSAAGGTTNDAATRNFAPGASAQLDGTFNGQGTSGTASYTVTYNTSGVAQLATDATGTTTSKSINFGAFPQTAIGTSTSAITYAAGEDAENYLYVSPNQTTTGDMTLYVDFTLTAEHGTDVIKVTGAKVTVPASSMVWNPNYAYTYVFNITKNTSGSTGGEGTDPAGLYPITFDAIVVDQADGTSTISTDVNPA